MRRVLAVLGAGALASGCSASTSTTIDNEKAQASVAEIVRDQVGSRVKSVSCPDDVPVSKGATFTCTVTGQDATTGKVSAKVTDPDKGRLFVSAPSLLHVRDAEQKIIAELAEQGGPPEKVACPELITVRKGGPFVCRATTQGQTVDVRATATDANGNFTFKTVRPTIIPSKAEALVTQLARDRLGIRVRSVSCPGGVALRKGASHLHMHHHRPRRHRGQGSGRGDVQGQGRHGLRQSAAAAVIAQAQAADDRVPAQAGQGGEGQLPGRHHDPQRRDVHL
jgi:hypothetical protein